MANCGCNTNKDLTDKNTAKCKKKSCTENTDLVSLVMISNSFNNALTEFENVFNEFEVAITEFCAGEHERFQTISEHVTTIVESGAECCTELNRKLSEIGDIIEDMDVDVEPTTTALPTTTEEITTTIEVTTTSEPTTTELITECCYDFYYNGYSIEGIGVNSIANTDWRVPTKDDWTQIYQGSTTPSVSTYIGMGQYKSTEDLCVNWLEPNSGALNTLGLNILPVGNRTDYDGTFASINAYCAYSYANAPTDEIYFIFNDANAISGTNGNLKWGNAVRLVKDAVGINNGATTTYVGNNGIIYNAVCINEIYILTENIKETLYRSGSPITKITDGVTWMAATGGAYCVYEDSETLCYPIVATTTSEPTTTGI